MSSGTKYLPGRDGDLANWLNNYVTVASANAVELGLTIADVQAVEGAAADFAADIADVIAIHAAAKSATVSKDGSRKTVEQIVRTQVKTMQANPNIPNTLRSQLRIAVPKPRRKALPVFVPAKLIVQIKAGGIVSLSWDANGNEAGVIYVVETSASATSGWTMVNAQSSLRFLDGGVSGASPVYYRVRARRAKVVSDPSNVVVVALGQGSARDALHLSDAA